MIVTVKSGETIAVPNLLSMKILNLLVVTSLVFTFKWISELPPFSKYDMGTMFMTSKGS